MSIEQLLFLLLLVGVPLLERLARAVRERAAREPVESAPEPVPPAVRRPPPPVPRPEPAATGPERGGGELPRPRSASPPPVAPPLPASTPPSLPPPARPPAPPQVLPQARERAAAERLRAAERQRAAGRERMRGPAPRVRARPSERPAARRVIDLGDLRRAIVLTTILGPCRALDSKDPTQLG